MKGVFSMKKTLFKVLVFILVLISSVTPSFAIERGPMSEEDFTKVYNEAKELLGTNYERASTDPEVGLDCDGFILLIFKRAFDFYPPRLAQEMYDFGVEIPLDEIQPGDLIVSDTFGTNTLNHVAMYVGNVEGYDEPQLIHSMPEEGVVYDRANYFDGRPITTAVRIYNDNNAEIAEYVSKDYGWVRWSNEGKATEEAHKIELIDPGVSLGYGIPYGDAVVRFIYGGSNPEYRGKPVFISKNSVEPVGEVTKTDLLIPQQDSELYTDWDYHKQENIYVKESTAIYNAESHDEVAYYYPGEFIRNARLYGDKYYFQLNNQEVFVNASNVTTDEVVGNAYAIQDTSLYDANTNATISPVRIGTEIQGTFRSDKIYFELDGQEVWVYKSRFIFAEPQQVYINKPTEVKEWDYISKTYDSVNTLYRGQMIQAVKIGDLMRFESDGVKFVDATNISNEELLGNVYVTSKVNVRDVNTSQIVSELTVGSYINGTESGNYIYFELDGQPVRVHKDYVMYAKQEPIYIPKTTKVMNIDNEVVDEKYVGEVIKAVKIGEKYRFFEDGETRFISLTEGDTEQQNGSAYTRYLTNIRNPETDEIMGTYKIGQEIQGIQRGNYLYFDYNNMEARVALSTVVYGEVKSYTLTEAANIRNDDFKFVSKGLKDTSFEGIDIGNYYRIWDNGVKIVHKSLAQPMN